MVQPLRVQLAALNCIHAIYFLVSRSAVEASTAYLCRGYQMPSRSIQSLCTGMSPIPWIVQQ